MTTFARWLLEHAGQPSAVGWLATEWNAVLHRPRVSTPAAIEKHLAEVHSGDETYIGQLASAVRIATDAYHHRDDPAPAGQATITVSPDIRATGGPQADQSGQDRRYQGVSPDEIAAAEQQMAAQAMQQSANQFDEDAYAAQFDDTRVWRMSVTQELADQSLMLDRVMGLVRSMAAVMGINVDDDSITAMTELWSDVPSAQQLIRDTVDGVADESLSAQLATPTPPQAFATWWGTADHEPPASSAPAG
jgi:hypothetical protein